MWINFDTVSAKVQERQNRVWRIVTEAYEHPAINDDKIEALFQSAMDKVFMYIFTWNKRYLHNYMTDNYWNTASEYYNLLHTVINPDNWTDVYMYILDRLH